MKKFIVPAVATILVTGVGVASTAHYNEYQNKQQHQAQAAAQVVADEVTLTKEKAAKDIAALKADLDKLTVECTKGKVAYEKLFAAVQKVTPAPTCPVPTGAVKGTVR